MKIRDLFLSLYRILQEQVQNNKNQHQQKSWKQEFQWNIVNCKYQYVNNFQEIYLCLFSFYDWCNYNTCACVKIFQVVTDISKYSYMFKSLVNYTDFSILIYLNGGGQFYF